MQRGFAVCMLPGIAQGLVRQRGALRQPREAVRLMADLAESAIVPAPAEVAFQICRLQQRAVQVGTGPVDSPGPVLTQTINPCQRAPECLE
jgi:hypothetical protein